MNFYETWFATFPRGKKSSTFNNVLTVSTLFSFIDINSLGSMTYVYFLNSSCKEYWYVFLTNIVGRLVLPLLN